MQSSSLPEEGALVNEEANHTESSTNSDTQENTVVGKWTVLYGTHEVIIFSQIYINPAIRQVYLKHGYLDEWRLNGSIWSNLYSLVLNLSDAMTDLDIQELANLTAGDADVDNFERLFTKLKEMKGKQDMNTCITLLGF